MCLTKIGLINQSPRISSQLLANHKINLSSNSLEYHKRDHSFEAPVWRQSLSQFLNWSLVLSDPLVFWLWWAELRTTSAGVPPFSALGGLSNLVQEASGSPWPPTSWEQLKTPKVPMEGLLKVNVASTRTSRLPTLLREYFWGQIMSETLAKDTASVSVQTALHGLHPTLYVPANKYRFNKITSMGKTHRWSSPIHLYLWCLPSW